MTLAIHTDSGLLTRLKELEAHIGNTPLFPITSVYKKKGVSIYAKLEWQQLSNSIKARAGFNIIKQAILEGKISRKKGLIDASSGNTGVAYATIGAALGIPVTLCIPENVSEQKKTALLVKGANIVYTSRFGTTDESQLKAKELAAANRDKYFYTDQYANHNNWKAHYNGTALEIWEQTEQQVTHFVSGLGTTGTFTGTSRRLKELNPNIEVVSLQPDSAMHGMEGWKHLESAIVPKIYDDRVADKNLFIDTMEAFELVKKVAKQEGLLISPSAAANLAGAIKIADSIEKGVIVTTFADHGSNYPEVMKDLFSY
ncbi:MAG: cysteine synthase family protein [Bacteroidetes bacterium]|nr:cysteine synthase family protein [Bacteroidota bacterium]